MKRLTGENCHVLAGHSLKTLMPGVAAIAC